MLGMSVPQQPARDTVDLGDPAAAPGRYLWQVWSHLSRRGLTARERFTQGPDGRSRPVATIQPRRYQGTARPSTEEPGRIEKAGAPDRQTRQRALVGQLN